jgi:hypothetical protein
MVKDVEEERERNGKRKEMKGGRRDEKMMIKL